MSLGGLFFLLALVAITWPAKSEAMNWDDWEHCQAVLGSLPLQIRRVPFATMRNEMAAAKTTLLGALDPKIWKPVGIDRGRYTILSAPGLLESRLIVGVRQEIDFNLDPMPLDSDADWAGFAEAINGQGDRLDLQGRVRIFGGWVEATSSETSPQEPPFWSATLRKIGGRREAVSLTDSVALRVYEPEGSPAFPPPLTREAISLPLRNRFRENFEGLYGPVSSYGKPEQVHFGVIASVMLNGMFARNGEPELRQFVSFMFTKTISGPGSATSYTMDNFFLRPWLLKQYAELDLIDIEGLTETTWEQWLDREAKVFGETLEVFAFPYLEP